jgi:hypothetical protein
LIAQKLVSFTEHWNENSDHGSLNFRKYDIVHGILAEIFRSSARVRELAGFLNRRDLQTIT